MRGLPGRAITWLRRRRGLRRLPLTLFSADARLEALVDRDSGLQRLAAGFGFVEGPVWVAEERALLFSDIPRDRICRLSHSGKVSIFRKPSRHSNGLTRDGAGRLIACEHGARRVTRTEADGRLTVLADRYAGLPLNSPNDVVEGPAGAIYFTDPPYGIPPGTQEQPVQGLYRLRGDQLELLIDDFDRPNGLAFSPDRSRLYVADSSQRRHLRVFDVGHGGGLRGGDVFLSMAEAAPGVPDGLKVDSMGNVYCTGPGGVWVIDPAGHHLGSILVPEIAANCAWGGEDWCSLYITAHTSVYRVRVRIPGLPVGAGQ